MTSPTETFGPWSRRWLPRLFALALLGLLALAAWQWRDGPPVSANLLELLPGGTPDGLRQRAEQRMQEPLNRDLVLLVRHADFDRARALSATIGERLRASGLYERVQWNLQADLPALRRQLLDGRLALLGDADRQRLIDDPRGYLEARVQRLYDPFGGFALVPAEQDWLGLADAIQRGLPHAGKVGIDLDGTLLAEDQGQSWALLRARTRGDAFEGDLPLRVAEQVAAARAEVQAADGRLLAASGLLYAAQGQRQAREESGLIGGLSSLAALALLLVVFRRLRVLLALLPALVGVLAGAVACVALQGHIHVLTLVLGASLIGVAIDYPLHYLSKSWTLQPWDTWRALRATLPGLTLGLATNAIGYLALSFTPFPALTQVAIFSAAGLLGSYLCAVCLLPALLGRAPIVPWPAPLRFAEALLALRRRLLRRLPTPWLFAALALFCLGGIAQLSLKDDLRQWIARAPHVQEEAQALARIVDFQPTSQFYLVRAADGDQLLQRQAELTRRLDRLVADGSLKGYLSLNQLLAPRAEQRRLRAALAATLKEAAPLQALGVDAAALDAEVQALRALPELDIEQGLAGPLGEPWRPLWLGADGNGVAGLVSLNGLSDAGRLAEQARDLPGVELVDRLGELNRLFAATQLSAAELKALSCLLIFLLLCLPFGWRGALRTLGVSLLGAIASLASLGWLGQPLTLFSLFGLLLVTAIGVDYAILMRERVGGAATSLLGTLMAALTTWLSFGLLALSGTPAVSNFGLAVGLGLGFGFLLSPWAADDAEDTP
ncbi:MMPL family transporter [Pseudomonas sp. RIT-PI-AD]|uniref:MMPL family transporter n=1 Tax=Pseudomonas sp. RIT-PI-AD TaxID=3035294 RepID=UPI0021DAB87A|nr:MMPL family transporter [Pseudomonas sp. RIT-PI-AD]